MIKRGAQAASLFRRTACPAVLVELSWRRYCLTKVPSELFAASCRELQAGSLRSPAIYILAVTLCLFASCKKPMTKPGVDPNGRVEVVIPEHGVYTGAFMDFGDAEDDVGLETIEDFEQMVGKHQAIIASSSY